MSDSSSSMTMSSGRKLRPIMPRPLLPNPINYSLSASSPSLTPNPNQSSSCSCCSSFLHKTNILSASTDQLAPVHDQGKQEDNTAPSSVTASSRWNPTMEQLRALEDLYEGGMRTPTADQIKLIAGRLRRFGKIEGKNVFYWFQNHKARERQKRRRHEHRGRLQNEEPAGFEVGLAKNNPTSNCSTNSEDSVSIHRAVEASESRAQGWIQLEERKLLQQIRRRTRITQSKHATWQLREPSSIPQELHLMATTRRAAPEEALNLSMSLAPSNRDMNVIKLEEEGGNPQTLELFPIRTHDRSGEKRNYEESIASIDASSFIPNQFFEFLPMKN